MRRVSETALDSIVNVVCGAAASLAASSAASSVAETRTATTANKNRASFIDFRIEILSLSIPSFPAAAVRRMQGAGGGVEREIALVGDRAAQHASGRSEERRVGK